MGLVSLYQRRTLLHVGCNLDVAFPVKNTVELKGESGNKEAYLLAVLTQVPEPHRHGFFFSATHLVRL